MPSNSEDFGTKTSEHTLENLILTLGLTPEEVERARQAAADQGEELESYLRHKYRNRERTPEWSPVSGEVVLPSNLDQNDFFQMLEKSTIPEAVTLLRLLDTKFRNRRNAWFWLTHEHRDLDDGKQPIDLLDENRFEIVINLLRDFNTGR
ncbi:MAG TPA: hypothetical protein VG965_06605 [Patescibacteria group bacterium]|nr:hypothetical protein [Patescibacteria group bacterium]